jgi:hypothetical protein
MHDQPADPRLPKSTQTWGERLAALEDHAIRLGEDIADILTTIETIAGILGLRTAEADKTDVGLKSNSNNRDGRNVENPVEPGFSATFTPLPPVQNPVDNL